jgi:D-alanine-D-alanine ligase
LKEINVMVRIAVLANLKKNAPPVNGTTDHWDDLDSMETLDNIVAALERGGHEASFFEASIAPEYDLVGRLREYQPDLCFNIAEGHWGDGREAQIPSILEMLRIPYTGSQVLTLAIALDKPMTKRVLQYHNLPTPEFQVFHAADESIHADLLNEDGDLKFPLFVKPSREGTGIGVSPSSIVRTVAELRERVSAQLEKYQQPILVERYIKGREVTVGVLGNLNGNGYHRQNERHEPLHAPEELFFFPVLEVDTDAYPTEAGLYTNRVKTELVHDFYYVCPAVLDPDIEHQLKVLTAAVFRVLDCKDVSRVDFRLDEEHNNQPYILEINPLPGLNPSYSDLCLQAKAAGWSYDELINAIADQAVRRYQLKGVRVAVAV